MFLNHVCDFTYSLYYCAMFYLSQFWMTSHVEVEVRFEKTLLVRKLPVDVCGVQLMLAHVTC
jgi:hypothetical protein